MSAISPTRLRLLGFSFFLSANASDEARYSNGYNLLFNVKGAVSAESGGSSEVLEGKFGEVESTDFFFGKLIMSPNCLFQENHPVFEV